MFSLFKQTQTSSTSQQQALLDKNALLDLRQLAERIDCTAISSRTLESRHSGHLPTNALGCGIDYAESRVYQPGDDTRSINWRLSARSHETFVKTFYVESRPALSVFLDRRRPMVFGTRKRLKITQALRVACLLAYASEYHQLDFHGWIIDDKGIEYFDHPVYFIEQGNRPCSAHTAESSVDTTDHFQQLLQDVIQRTPKSSLVYLISDFSDLSKGHQSELARLYEHCFVQVLHILDKAELSLPTMGSLRLQDMTENRNYKLDTSRQSDLDRFKQCAQQYLDKKKTLFKVLNISYVLLETDVENLQKYIRLPLGQV